MAKYCIEKFERTGGTGQQGEEVRVYWKQNKHEHNATLTIAIAQWLGVQRGGTWSARTNSFQSNQPEPTGNNVVEYAP